MYRELAATPAGRAVLGLAAALTVAVAVALVVLWPSGDADVGTLAVGDTQRAEVLRVERGACPLAPQARCQVIRAQVEGGERTTLSLPDSAFTPEVSAGDGIRVAENQAVPGAPAAERYAFVDFERTQELYLLALVFAVLVIALARWKGVRSLLGLALSLVVVTQFIVPAILEGAAPVPVALTGALAVMLVTIGLTHGLGIKSLAAVLGAAAALLVTAGLAALFVELATITGLASEEVGFLLAGRDPAAPALSLQGLLLAGIVVAALGVLDDVTISQASTVMALRRANPAQSARRLVRGGLAVGRDHLGATVNTLVLAYVGAALPVLLIFEKSGTTIGDAINQEAVAAEVVAMLVGSIGLVLALPLTTALAAWLAVRVPESVLGEEHVHTH